MWQKVKRNLLVERKNPDGSPKMVNNCVKVGSKKKK